MFKIIKTKDYEEMSEKTYEVIREVVVNKPDCVLGLATGSSPIGTYQRLVKDHQENGTSYKKVTTFNLDEYLGIPKTHPQSYWTFMHENLFNYLDCPEENIHVPADGPDKQKQCELYEESMKGYQVDIQLLGIGTDGHIGFNEPGTSFDSLTHIADLKESTIKDNARLFFDNDISKVPTQAITMGIATVMKAKKIILIASGKNKAKAIHDMINGPVTEDMPASILQKHPDVVIVVDNAAAELL